MADIRFKDLTTTASSTASDDFFAVDGTTNGTRKLNAFSPTFGGNATVTGTLTANSTSSFADRITLRKDVAGNVEQLIDNRNTAGGEVIYLSEDGLSTEYAYIARYNSAHATTSKRKALEFGVNGTGAFYNFASGVLKVSDTTASTTTSTGALVVGNGTSGGLGVGGAIVAGGTITSTASTDSGLLQLNLVNSSTGTSASSLFRFNAGTRTASLQAYNDTHATLAGQLRVGTSNGDIVLVPSGVASATFAASATTLVGTLTTSNFIKSVNTSAANDTEFTALRADVGADGTLGAAVVAIGSLPSATGASRYGFITCSDNVDWRKLYIGGRPGLASSGGQVLIPCTASSTTTSSGALVVSGGVGVAGAIYAGGNITIDKAAPDFTLTRSVNTNSGLIQLTTSTTYDFAIGLRNTTDSDLHIYNYGTSNDALKIARSDSLATFGGAVRTAAPSGGTAANWKLGTVASVSPTSPNRTIEVDIGGTIYYIHAKTTNN